MRQKSQAEGSTEKTVKDICRATRKRHASEEKIVVKSMYARAIIIKDGFSRSA